MNRTATPRHRLEGNRRHRRALAVAPVAVAMAACLALGAFTALASAASANLVANPGFETSTANWRTNSAAEILSRVNKPHSGNYAGRLTTTSTVTAVLNDNPNTVASTVAGAVYTAGAWIRTTTPTVGGEIRIRDVASGVQVGKASTSFALSDKTWHFVTVTYKTSASGDSLDLNVAADNLPVGKNLFIDDVSLTMTAPSPAPSPSATATSPAPSPSATATSPAPSPSATATSPAPSPTATTPTCTVSAILVPSCGIWTGVAPNSLSGETWDQSLVNFESITGHTTDIAHYYHRDAQLFPTSQEIARATEPGKNRLLLENWKPENGNTWAAVAAGASDSSIDAEASYIKSNFTRRFFLAIHGEPERSVNQTAGSGYTAADYAAMYRHVILRLRADGVTNVVSVLDLTGMATWGSQPWFGQLYPGNDVVDWLAEDPYEIGPAGGWYDNNYVGFVNRTFPGYSFPGFYTWASQVAPGKPIMIAEWGVDELSTDASWKPGKFANFAANLSALPNVKALVYWNSNNFNPVGTTRVDSSTASLDAYRKLLAQPELNQPVPTN